MDAPPRRTADKATQVKSPSAGAAIYGKAWTFQPGFRSAVAGARLLAVRAMKIVLRHTSTGRYYRAPGEWVRRADNALAFDDLNSAQQFVQAHHLNQTQTVYRLAPYLIPLLHQTEPSFWKGFAQGGRDQASASNPFSRN